MLFLLNQSVKYKYRKVIIVNGLNLNTLTFFVLHLYFFGKLIVLYISANAGKKINND